MSSQPATPQKRLTAPDIAAKKGVQPIVSLTAYHAHTAALADKYCDFLLVGDSLGMVMHGYETTVPVPLELMIMHGRRWCAAPGMRWSWSTCRSAPTRRARGSRSAMRRG